MSYYTSIYYDDDTPNTKEEDSEHTLLFQSKFRPRTVSHPLVTYSEITQIFHDQLHHEQNSINPGADTDYIVYQPILGNEQLSSISNLSGQRYSSVFELEQTLSQLRRAIADWDLILIKSALRSQELDGYLKVIKVSNDTEEKKRRIIKRLILEYVTGAVHPWRHVKVIREKELSLVILLNTL